MIKKFEINDKVSFKGSVDYEALDETTVSWVNNDMYQAIIEHPEGHSGSEIPGKGLVPDKTYAFVKTDHLDNWSERSEEDEVTDVEAEKVDGKETPSEPKPKTSNAEQNKKADLGEQPPVSVSLQAFRNTSEEKYLPLIDHLINEALKWERREDDPEKILKKKQQREEADIKTAEVTNEHAANRLKAQKRQRENIKKIIQMAKNDGRLIYGKMLESGKTVGATAVLDGEVITENLTWGNEELADEELANYFQNMSDDYSEFVVRVTQEAPNPDDQFNKTVPASSDNDTGESNKTKKSEEKSSDKEETITYEKKDQEKSESKELAIVKDNYFEMLVNIKGVGEKTANDIMKSFPDPAELVEAVAKDITEFSPRANGSLKKAFKNGYFYKSE